MAPKREFKLIGSPETQSDWPIPPEYAPLWTVSQIEEALAALITFRGHEAMPVVDQAEVLGLILRIVKDYNLALSKTQFDLWAIKGVKSGAEGLVSE